MVTACLVYKKHKKSTRASNIPYRSTQEFGPSKILARSPRGRRDRGPTIIFCHDFQKFRSLFIVILIYYVILYLCRNFFCLYMGYKDRYVGDRVGKEESGLFAYIWQMLYIVGKE